MIKFGAERGTQRHEEVVATTRERMVAIKYTTCTNRGVVLTSNDPACRWRGSSRRMYALS